MRPFTPAQIKLLETFADQAVIAIENVRLFKELKESLEQQTATSEILGVMPARRRTFSRYFETLLKNAARLCECRSRDDSPRTRANPSGGCDLKVSRGLETICREVPASAEQGKRVAGRGYA